MQRVSPACESALTESQQLLPLAYREVHLLGGVSQTHGRLYAFPLVVFFPGESLRPSNKQQRDANRLNVVLRPG